jgi:AcrR family transcriptional regulator
MSTPEPLIRPPLQRRSQASLERVLDAGLQVLQEQGVAGFTLQDVSRRSGVSIGSIYARVNSREALIMAIYEHAMRWTEEEAINAEEVAARGDLAPRERIEMLVTDTANMMLAHGEVLRVFMRQAPLNSEIWRRGAEKSQANAHAFEGAMLAHRADIGHPDPDLAVDIAFRMIYCTIARRITHGPVFETARVVSDEELVRELARAAANYLIGV